MNLVFLGKQRGKKGIRSYLTAIIFNYKMVFVITLMPLVSLPGQFRSCWKNTIAEYVVAKNGLKIGEVEAHPIPASQSYFISILTTAKNYP